MIIDSQILSDRARAEAAAKIATGFDGMNPEYVSLVEGQLPGDYVEDSGSPIGAYLTSDGLLQKVSWNFTAEVWDNFGPPAPTKEYVDDLFDGVFDGLIDFDGSEEGDFFKVNEEGLAVPINFTQAARDAVKIEWGENADGQWVKFYETPTTGTMICKSIEIETHGSDVSTGGLHISHFDDRGRWDFPQAFSAAPWVKAENYGANSAFSKINESSLEHCRIMSITGAASTTTRQHSVIAIGEFNEG